MIFNIKEALINSYFMSNFNYCPLVWIFSSAKSLIIIEDLQKRALRFLLDDYESIYEQLLNKAGRSSMSINGLRALCVEVYKTGKKFRKSLFFLYFQGV